MAKPVRCERCGRENDPSFTACLDCGLPLPRTAPSSPSVKPVAAPVACPRCAAQVLPGFRFCGRCGAELGTTPAPDSPAGGVNGPVRGLRLSTVRTDGSPGDAFPLRAPTTVCGRVEGDIQIQEDSTVSPRHASFAVQGERVTVEDLGSVNGVFLRIRSPCRLAVGEEIRLGRQLLRLEPLPRADGEQHSWGGADPGCRVRLAQLLDGGGLGEIHPLQEGENVIGREDGTVVFAGDRYLSARHARIDLTGEVATVSDLGSSNGTFRKITGPTPIAPGDQLLIGAQLLKLES
jgi:pSer/pThr/pTyr-binding forkhead associated (FHA) protein